MNTISTLKETKVFHRSIFTSMRSVIHDPRKMPLFPLLRSPKFNASPHRHYARMLSHPPQAEYTFGLSWQVIAPVLLLGTGSAAMLMWYFSSNEFLDEGFPPRAAEAFRIAALSSNDWQLRHSIRHWRAGIEIAIEHGMSPFDERLLKIKGRLMETIKKDGDVAAEREVLEEIRAQALQEIRGGNAQDRGRLIAYAVQAAISLANVPIVGFS